PDHDDLRCEGTGGERRGLVASEGDRVVGAVEESTGSDLAGITRGLDPLAWRADAGYTGRIRCGSGPGLLAIYPASLCRRPSLSSCSWHHDDQRADSDG